MVLRLVLFACMNSFISTKEAAKRLHISVRRVQALIAAGRLPAEKIGNSFAIKEIDLKVVDGRKNGRPTNDQKPEEKDCDALIDKFAGSVKGLPPDLSTNKRYLDGLRRVNGGLGKGSTQSEKDWDTILDKVLGRHDFGPSDLATNKRHLEGLGRD